MSEVRQSRRPRQPIVLSIAAALVFAAAFGGSLGEQLAQASQAEPVVDSITFEDRFVRLIFPGHTHRHARRRLPLIVYLHGFAPFPDVVDRSLTNHGYHNLPGKYDVIVAAPMGTLHPQLGSFFWNATGACCGFESVYGPQVDDAGFLVRLVEELIANYPDDDQSFYRVSAWGGGRAVVNGGRAACPAVFCGGLGRHQNLDQGGMAVPPPPSAPVIPPGDGMLCPPGPNEGEKTAACARQRRRQGVRAPIARYGAWTRHPTATPSACYITCPPTTVGAPRREPESVYSITL